MLKVPFPSLNVLLVSELHNLIVIQRAASDPRSAKLDQTAPRQDAFFRLDIPVATSTVLLVCLLVTLSSCSERIPLLISVRSFPTDSLYLLVILITAYVDHTEMMVVNAISSCNSLP